MQMQDRVKRATEEMMKAWAMVRRDYPGDHPINAERILKKAFSTLNVSAETIVSAQALSSMYGQLR